MRFLEAARKLAKSGLSFEFAIGNSNDKIFRNWKPELRELHPEFSHVDVLPDDDERHHRVIWERV